MTSDVISIEDDGTAGRRVELGDEVEARTFAGSVGPDDGMNGVTLDLEVHIVDCDKSHKLLGQGAGLDHEWG